MNDYVMHYGTPRHSGRYPWGSSGHTQRTTTIYDRIDDLVAQGLISSSSSEKEVANMLNCSIRELRAMKSYGTAMIRADNQAAAIKLKAEGWGNSRIAQELELPISTVSSYVKPQVEKTQKKIDATTGAISSMVDSGIYLDIGSGSEQYLGISRTMLDNAASLLQASGKYEIKTIQIEQLGTTGGQKTTVKVLVPSGTQTTDIYDNKDNIRYPTMKASEDGLSYSKFYTPTRISKDSVGIVYAEDGGTNRDGLILIRQGAEGLDLGNSTYAQVRIGVGDDKYLKGMCMYDTNNQIPAGKDVLFYTNKSSDTSFDKVLKTMKDPTASDPALVFGSSVVAQKGALNIVNQEGNWQNWSNTLSTQFLSKQNASLVNRQLTTTLKSKESEFKELLELDNPVIKEQLLLDFASDLDASAVHLKAASVPRTSQNVLLPFNEVKSGQIYAPKYQDGETVVLVRHPHGGTFEIPTLTVNNKNPTLKAALGNAIDAVGINHDTAEYLSGADFDGDTALVIPNNDGAIKTSTPLAGLKGFDPSASYPKYEGMKVMSTTTRDKEMGMVSNLITDMTIKGASTSELERAVRHSMVVIDAAKHELNYKKSAEDNGIAALKKKYQDGGASTLVSKASQEIRVDERQVGANNYTINPDTGEKIYKQTGNTYVDKNGVTQTRTTKTTLLGETKNAYDLSSGTQVEGLYADYSNNLKDMANQARKIAVSQEKQIYDPQAKSNFSPQVESLNAKLAVAKSNAPVERQAQILASSRAKAVKEANPDMSNSDYTKIKNKMLVSSRDQVGASKTRITITDLEWTAIQSGAISDSKLREIITHSDKDALKALATPRTNYVMTDAKIAKASAMLASGKTYAEIAASLGVSASAVIDNIG